MRILGFVFISILVIIVHGWLLNLIDEAPTNMTTSHQPQEQNSPDTSQDVSSLPVYDLEAKRRQVQSALDTTRFMISTELSRRP